MGQDPRRPLRFADVIKAIDYCMEGFISAGRMIKLEENPNSKWSVMWRCRVEIISLRDKVAAQQSIINHLQAENYRLANKESLCPPPSITLPPIS